MYYLRLDGVETETTYRGKTVRRWEVVRKTEEAIRVKEVQELYMNGKFDISYENEAWIPKNALNKILGTPFIWIEPWALRGKNIHPLQIQTALPDGGKFDQKKAEKRIAMVLRGPEHAIFF